MPSRSVRRTRLHVEALEDRWAPATLVSPTQITYQDSDGDPVRVTFSKPILTSAAVANSIFTFNNGSVNDSDVAQQQLWEIDLSMAAGAAGTDIKLEVDVGILGGGDLRANVGYINAQGLDLGKVIIDGDLGRIDVGDDQEETQAVKKLRVASMGVAGLTTQGGGGNLETNMDGPVGKIVVEENIQHAQIEVNDLGLLSIGNSLIGGGQESDGLVFVFGSLGDVHVGGSLQGASGDNSGAILVFGPIGDVTVGGSVSGGSGEGSGRIVAVAGTGSVHIGGDVTGGAGTESGMIGAFGKLSRVTVLGNLTGGAGESSGIIESSTSIGKVAIGEDLVGGTGERSGRIRSVEGKIKSMDIGGYLVGGGGLRSGWIDGAGGLGSLNIGKGLGGGNGAFSGRVESSAGSIGDITIEGAIGIDGNVPASIAARDNLGNIVVKDGIFGAADDRVIISAGGVESNGPARIGNITVIGEMNFTDILAGYNAIGTASPVHSNGDAQIGKVTVTGNWVASNLVAGLGRGADGYFGTADDDDNPIGSSSFISKIGAVTIAGEANGTASGGDHFGIVAEQVKSLSTSGVVQVLSPGPLNDQNLEFSTSTFDMVMSELAA